MPELPEVETIARYLRLGTPRSRGITGLSIEWAEVLWERTIAAPDSQSFCTRLSGQRVESVSRRGKLVLLTLTRDSLLIHLRMSGDLLVLNDPSVALPIHARMVIHFNDGIRLVFNDPRKFGRVWLTDILESVTGNLGPEPLDAALKPQAFHTRITKNHRQLKPLLLDQRFLAGIGNIYCDEALHLARLHPLRISDSLSVEESARLLHAIRMVLTQGIEQNGASIDWVYRGGDFQNHFRAYGRSGEPCLVCGTIMEHLRVGQRSTHICPNCQPINGG
jgi:formamidopyrimidine-DNA glycosylase